MTPMWTPRCMFRAHLYTIPFDIGSLRQFLSCIPLATVDEGAYFLPTKCHGEGKKTPSEKLKMTNIKIETNA